jgi:F1F0 ATPase subunit 2
MWRRKMSEISTVSLALLGGILLGAAFFGGLWWTIRLGVSSKQPAVWFSGSLLVRTAIVLAGFYLISRDDWRRLVSCLFGFVLARMVVTRLTRAPRQIRGQIIEEGAR